MITTKVTLHLHELTLVIDGLEGEIAEARAHGRHDLGDIYAARRAEIIRLRDRAIGRSAGRLDEIEREAAECPNG